MKTRLHAILAALALLAPAAALAIDAPHDGSLTTGNCDACHQLHNAAGGTLTTQPDNNTVCSSCHLTRSPAFGFGWLNGDQAVPGVVGNHHSWSGWAANATYGAALPANVDMARRVADGRLQCSTCHDQHAANRGNLPAAQHVSVTTGSALAATGGATAGTPTRLTVNAPTAAAAAKGYRVKIARLAGASFEVVLSNDAAAAAPTWYFWNGSAWTVGNSTNNPGATLFTGSPTITLNDGANVTVTVTGAPVAGPFWDFYVSYPFLRMSNVSDAMCLDCHASRNQTFTDVRGGNAALPPNTGTTTFSHPVGHALNANALGHDQAAPRDANGALQTDAVNRDANTTNDLKLDGNLVRCTTCHAVHNADSNSLTQDVR